MATMSQPSFSIQSKQPSMTNVMSDVGGGNSNTNKRPLLGLINVDRIHEIKRTAERMQHLSSLGNNENPANSNSILDRFKQNELQQ